jgi:hypothetical protein
MTKLLEQAFEKAARLPDIDQELLAKWLLQELDSERRWQDLFDSSADQLSRMADEALAEHQEQGTPELDPDKL